MRTCWLVHSLEHVHGLIRVLNKCQQSSLLYSPLPSSLLSSATPPSFFVSSRAFATTINSHYEYNSPSLLPTPLLFLFRRAFFSPNSTSPLPPPRSSLPRTLPIRVRNSPALAPLDNINVNVHIHIHIRHNALPPQSTVPVLPAPHSHLVRGCPSIPCKHRIQNVSPVNPAFPQSKTKIRSNSIRFDSE